MGLAAQQAEMLHDLVARSKRDSFTPEQICHPKQRAQVEDGARNVTICAGRRSGKTVGAALRLLLVALAYQRCNAAFIGATQASVKRNCWKPLLDFNRDYGLGGVPNYSELSLTMPNGSTIYFLGVDTEKLADKIRGIPRLKLAIVDECQRYADDVLRTLTRDAIRPALRDLAGCLWLMGTPAVMGEVGVFWEAVNNPKWSHHSFTIYDNTKLEGDTETIITEDLEAEGLTKESAWFQREYLARWVVELAARVYAFDESLNLYDDLPEGLEHWIIGVDVGAADADAIAPIGWGDTRWAYLAHEDVARNQTVDQLAAKLLKLYELLDPIKVVIDSGGGGLKTLISLQALLPDVPLEAAVKPTLDLQVKQTNNLLRPGRLKVRRGCQFSADVRRFGWVDGIVGGKVVEKDKRGKRHSDIVPAVRYGVIAAASFLPAEEAGDARTPAQRRDAEAEAAAAVRRRRAERGATRHRMQEQPEDDAPGLGYEDPMMEDDL